MNLIPPAEGRKYRGKAPANGIFHILCEPTAPNRPPCPNAKDGQHPKTFLARFGRTELSPLVIANETGAVVQASERRPLLRAQPQRPGVGKHRYNISSWSQNASTRTLRASEPSSPSPPCYFIRFPYVVPSSFYNLVGEPSAPLPYQRSRVCLPQSLRMLPPS
jgi:hypothetical protein